MWPPWFSSWETDVIYSWAALRLTSLQLWTLLNSVDHHACGRITHHAATAQGKAEHAVVGIGMLACAATSPCTTTA